jgi:hypothetical protein
VNAPLRGYRPAACRSGGARPERETTLAARLALLILAFLASGCDRVDTFRFAHANGGTPLEWPSGASSVELALVDAGDGRSWLPVSVDGNPPVPFLLQAGAGAIALTGARAAGFGPAGRLTLHGEVLPGIPGGTFIRQRRLGFGELSLGDQSLLLVEAAAWPHGTPRGPAAGVIGHDLFRRFTVELDVDGGRIALYRPGGLDLGRMPDVQRLAVLGRTPYFEARVRARGGDRWVRLQFEPADPAGICLDSPLRGAVVSIAGEAIPVDAAPCAAPGRAGRRDGRDGVFGARALAGLVVAVDFEGGQIGFRPHEAAAVLPDG